MQISVTVTRCNVMWPSPMSLRSDIGGCEPVTCVLVLPCISECCGTCRVAVLAVSVRVTVVFVSFWYSHVSVTVSQCLRYRQRWKQPPARGRQILTRAGNFLDLPARPGRQLLIRKYKLCVFKNQLRKISLAPTALAGVNLMFM